MGYRGNVVGIPLSQSGFQHPRNVDLVMAPAFIEPTRNVNLHEGGTGKRGGTDIYLANAISGNPVIRGIYQFRKRNAQFLIFHTAAGNVYHTDEAHLLANGMSGSAYPSIITFDEKVFICDGSSAPKYWNGTSPSAIAVTAATTWISGNWPFQFIPHSRAASHRLWALTTDGVWASKLNDGTDFSDAHVQQIPVYTEGGLVGGADFGGTLFVWSKTQGYIIDDSDVDPTNWGYHEVQWEGGLAHWRLIVHAGNDLHLMAEDGLAYSIHGVQATGDYTAAPLTRPASIDRWMREQVNFGSIEKFHGCYDRKLRAIKWFVQAGGANTNTALCYFIDKDPAVAWIPHNNDQAASGYDAASSTEVRVSAGTYEIWTGSWSGQIWKLEQSDRSDAGAAYRAGPKFKRLNFDKPRNWKHFRSCQLRSAAQGNFHLIVRVWVDGVRRDDIPLTIVGQGATFDAALFDTDVFAADDLVPTDFEIGTYGYDIQLEIINEEPGEDFFHTEIQFVWKDCGVRL